MTTRIRAQAPPFSDGFRLALMRLKKGYVHFLPGIVIVWTLVGAVAPGVKGPTFAVSAALFCLGYVYYGAAAARAAERWDQSVFGLALYRAGAALSTLGLALAGGILFLICTGVVLLVLGSEHELTEPALIALTVLALAALFRRFRPLLVIGFLYGGEVRYSPAAGGSYWAGPGMGTAWRMTRTPGAAAQAALPLLVCTTLMVGAWMGLRSAAKGGWLTLAADLYFYAGALPFLTCLADALAEGIRVRTRWD